MLLQLAFVLLALDQVMLTVKVVGLYVTDKLVTFFNLEYFVETSVGSVPALKYS